MKARKILSVCLAAVLLVSVLTVAAIPVAAAKTTAYDFLSQNTYAKVYTLSSSGRTIPYTSKYLSTRGSVTYGRSSSAYIDNRADELYLCDVGVTNGKYWAYVSYPIGSRRAYAYIPLNAITGNNGSHIRRTATGKFYCAPRNGWGTSSSYYVAKGDAVYLLNTNGSQYQILYPISGGKWRIGFCSKSDYNRYCNTVSTPTDPWQSKVGTTVASIKSGSSYTKYYNSSGNISAKGGYYGQCTWYAYGRFYEVTGIKLKTAPHAKYWLSNNKNDSRLRVTYGESGLAAKTIAVRTTGTYGHVMFVEHVTYANGRPTYVYFTECNSDNNGRYDAGKDCVLQRMSYADFLRLKNPAGYIAAR